MKLTIKEGLLIRSIAGEHVLIDASGEVDFSKMAMLSDTAVSVISALQKEPLTTEEIVRRLAAEYDVTAEEAKADVDELLAEMERQGLVAIERTDTVA